MKTFRIICAAPFFGIGIAFMGLAALVLGDHHVEWLEDAPRNHH